MSLFQAREWWVASIGSDEEFAHHSLVVANIDNDSSGDEKIVTGSFNGVLRVYYPRQRDYKIDDLMLEQSLDQPIIGLLAGRFTAGLTALAVLHPRKLVVYQVSAEGDGSFYKLKQLYSHNLGVDGLHFTACNMCKGPFGGAYGKDFLCVQSMDGQLSFFEQDNAAFTRQLDTCMLPGPIIYCDRTDSIITGSSDLHIESYKYQMLAAASSARPKEGSRGGPGGAGGGAGAGGRARKGLTSGKKIRVDWRVNIGEHAVDLAVARFSEGVGTSQVDILVLGEHTLYVLRETGGAIRMQQRVNYGPSCFIPYLRNKAASDGATDNLLVGSFEKQLMVYRGARLAWASTMGDVPVALAVSKFGGLRGLVVSLDDGGTVRVTYMGTDPPTSTVSAADSKELNYEEMDNEHRRLLTQVKESHSENRPEPSDRVLLRAQVPSVLDVGEDDEDEDGVRGRRFHGAGVVEKPGSAKITVRLFISYTGSDEINNLNVSLAVPQSVVASETAVVISSLVGARTPTIVPFTFHVNSAVMPSDLTVRVAAAYITAAGEPRTAQLTVELPLCITCRLIPPLKNNTFKFTLDTNRMPPQLPVLFDDMFSQPGLTEDAIQRITASSANVLTFQYYNGDDATILVSKSAGRYRVQSGNLQALWMVSRDLVRRLNAHFSSSDDTKKGAGGGAAAHAGGEEQAPFQIAYQEPLPLADFFACIDDHFQCRMALAEANAQLNDRAHQFRLIQKRLLVRFKERNPSPLNNLDMLLTGTYNQLIDLGSEVEECQKSLSKAANDLSCATHLLLLLMRYRFDLDDNNFDVLQAHLSPSVADNAEQGWEECTDAAMTHLLRTCLAKSAKDTAAVPQPLAVPQDTTKLKKHITIVCDRLTKGARLYRPRRSKK